MSGQLSHRSVWKGKPRESIVPQLRVQVFYACVPRKQEIQLASGFEGKTTRRWGCYGRACHPAERNCSLFCARCIVLAVSYPDKFSLSKLGHFKFMLCESFKRSFSESKHPVLRLRRYARKQQTMYCVHLLLINNK